MDRVSQKVYKDALEHSIKLHNLLALYGDHLKSCTFHNGSYPAKCSCGYFKAKATPSIHPYENTERN